MTLWHADYVNYLAIFVIKPKYSSHEKRNFFSDLNHNFLDDPFFYKRGLDQIIHRYVTKDEHNQLLEYCYSSHYKGHFVAIKTIAKVL